MPNIRVLAKAVLQIFCSQVFHTKSKKGHNYRTTRLVEEKNTGPLIFHVHATYIISRFKHKRFLSFSAAKYYRQTDGRTGPNQYDPSTSPKMGA